MPAPEAEASVHEHGFPPPHRRGGLNAFLFGAKRRETSLSTIDKLAGRHRLAAMETLGWLTVPALILHGIDAIAAELAEIIENLHRIDLTPAERKLHTARFKELYVLKYPETETKHGGNPVKTGKGKGAGKQSRQFGDTVDRFTKAAAEASGRSERTVQRDCADGKTLAVVLPDVVGTSLDKAGEIEALAKLSPEEQARLVKRAKAGEEVTARLKELYEAQHPETKPGSAPAKKSGKGGKVAKSATLPDRLTKKAAEASGRSERSVQPRPRPPASRGRRSHGR
jgi:ParB-like chromosome segregation protein Spo0J